jgi:hypothetical protein
VGYREKNTEIQRDRLKEKKKERERETNRPKDRERETDRERERQKDRKNDRKNRKTERQKGTDLREDRNPGIQEPTRSQKEMNQSEGRLARPPTRHLWVRLFPLSVCLSLSLSLFISLSLHVSRGLGGQGL